MNQPTFNLSDEEAIVLERMGFADAEALVHNHLSGGVKELRQEKAMNLLEATEAAPDEVVAQVASDLKVDPDTFAPVAEDAVADLNANEKTP